VQLATAARSLLEAGAALLEAVAARSNARETAAERGEADPSGPVEDVEHHEDDGGPEPG
jgi:hypothetical protein